MAGFDHIHGETATGTLGGTALAVIFQFNGNEILKTALLAFVGAAVSFIATKFCRWLWKKITGKCKKKNV